MPMNSATELYLEYEGSFFITTFFTTTTIRVFKAHKITSKHSNLIVVFIFIFRFRRPRLFARTRNSRKFHLRQQHEAPSLNSGRSFFLITHRFAITV